MNEERILRLEERHTEMAQKQAEHTVLIETLTKCVSSNTKAVHELSIVMQDVHVTLKEQAAIWRFVKWTGGVIFTVWVGFKMEIAEAFKWLGNMGSGQ